MQLSFCSIARNREGGANGPEVGRKGRSRQGKENKLYGKKDRDNNNNNNKKQHTHTHKKKIKEK